MTDEQVARLRELAERARKPQGWKRIAFQAARLDEFREAASPDVVIRLLDELDRLRHENHNLNWALGTDGYEQMYTEAERVEHADAVARITEHLDRLAARKARLDALVPAGVDILDHIDTLRRERDEQKRVIADAYAALGPDAWWMDPPDGGSPTLAEMVEKANEDGRALYSVKRERDAAMALLWKCRDELVWWCNAQNFMPDDQAELLARIDTLLGDDALRWPRDDMGREVEG